MIVHHPKTDAELRAYMAVQKRRLAEQLARDEFCQRCHGTRRFVTRDGPQYCTAASHREPAQTQTHGAAQ